MVVDLAAGGANVDRHGRGRGGTPVSSRRAITSPTNSTWRPMPPHDAPPRRPTAPRPLVSATRTRDPPRFDLSHLWLASRGRRDLGRRRPVLRGPAGRRQRRVGDHDRDRRRPDGRRRRRWPAPPRSPGVDLIALLAMVGALALGEYVAGAVIALMLASGEALEAYADRRAHRELSALLARAPRVRHPLRGRRTGDAADRGGHGRATGCS